MPSGYKGNRDWRRRRDRIDLGLAILSAVRVPGVRYTRVEIAAFCGCTPQGIAVIERKALRKLQKRLQGVCHR